MMTTVTYATLRKMLGDLYKKIETLNDWEQMFVGDVLMNRDFTPAQKRAIKQCWFRHADDEEIYQLALANGLTEPGSDRPVKLEPVEAIKSKRPKETAGKTTQRVAISELVKRYGLPDFVKRGPRR